MLKQSFLYIVILGCSSSVVLFIWTVIIWKYQNGHSTVTMSDLQLVPFTGWSKQSNNFMTRQTQHPVQFTSNISHSAPQHVPVVVTKSTEGNMSIGLTHSSTETQLLSSNVATSSSLVSQMLHNETLSSSLNITSSWSAPNITSSSSAPTMGEITLSVINVSSSRQSKVERKLLCLGFHGRFGNELFQYASVLGLAFTMNRTPVFNGGKEIHRALKNPIQFTYRDSNLAEKCSKAKISREGNCCSYFRHLTNLDPNFDYRVGGYLQSWKYFIKFKTQIREAIRFSDSIVDKAKAIVGDLRKRYTNSPLIGVHMRKGDFGKIGVTKGGYVSASSEYVNRSLSYFRNIFPDAVFVVFSDDVAWCKINFPQTFTLEFMNGNSPSVDMAALSMTDHIVISTGTFSWWAGFLNQGITVYVKDFIAPGTIIGRQFNNNGTDYIYPGWIPL